MQEVMFGFIGAGLFFGVFFLFCYIREKMEERDARIAYEAVDGYIRGQTLKKVSELHREWAKEAEAKKSQVNETVISPLE